MNSIVATLQNWINPLPPAKTAATLEDAKTAVLTIPDHFDVSLEWVKNLDGKNGLYAIRPVRANCCVPESTQSAEAVRATKQAIRNELNSKLKFLTATTTAVGSKTSSLFSTQGKETETSRQVAIKKITTYLTQLEAAHAEDPHAPVNREFLMNVFSERDIQDVTEGNEKTPLLAAQGAMGAQKASQISSPSDEIQEKEVKEIVTLLNRVIKESAMKKRSVTDNIMEERQPGYCRKRDFNALARDKNDGLSEDARALLTAIRKPENNWIDQALTAGKSVTTDQAMKNIIAQFPG